jgi:hypothetical protein
VAALLQGRPGGTPFLPAGGVVRAEPAARHGLRALPAGVVRLVEGAAREAETGIAHVDPAAVL